MSSGFPLGPSNLYSTFKYTPDVKQIKISGQIVFKYLVIPVNNNMCTANLYFYCVPNCHIWLWYELPDPREYSRYCTTGIAQEYCAHLFVLPVYNACIRTSVIFPIWADRARSTMFVCIHASLCTPYTSGHGGTPAVSRDRDMKRERHEGKIHEKRGTLWWSLHFPVLHPPITFCLPAIHVC